MDGVDDGGEGREGDVRVILAASFGVCSMSRKRAEGCYICGIYWLVLTRSLILMLVGIIDCKARRPIYYGLVQPFLDSHPLCEVLRVGIRMKNRSLFAISTPKSRPCL